MKSKIVWKFEEKQAVAQRSYEIILDPSFTGSEIEAVRVAQREVIHTDRQRQLISMQEVSAWIRTMWKALEEKGHKPQPKAIRPVIDPQIEADIQSRQKTLLLSDISMTDLMIEFVRRVETAINPKTIQAMVRHEVNAVLERRMPGILPPDPLDAVEEFEAPEEKQRMPKVLILGLRNDQQQIMRKAYNNSLDLHFLDGSEGTTRVRNTVGLMDYSVRSQWCKGHLGSTKDWQNFTQVHGGLDSIKRMINTRFKINNV